MQVSRQVRRGRGGRAHCGNRGVGGDCCQTYAPVGAAPAAHHRGVGGGRGQREAERPRARPNLGQVARTLRREFDEQLDERNPLFIQQGALTAVEGGRDARARPAQDRAGSGLWGPRAVYRGGGGAVRAAV